MYVWINSIVKLNLWPRRSKDFNFVCSLIVMLKYCFPCVSHKQTTITKKDMIFTTSSQSPLFVSIQIFHLPYTVVNIFACSGVPLSLIITLQFLVHVSWIHFSFFSVLALMQSQNFRLSGFLLQMLWCLWASLLALTVQFCVSCWQVLQFSFTLLRNSVTFCNIFLSSRGMSFLLKSLMTSCSSECNSHDGASSPSLTPAVTLA